MSSIIKFDEFEIEVTKKRVKYARLRVKSDASITLTIPLNYTKLLTILFLENIKEWLREMVAKRKALMLPENQTMLLGQIYTLKLNESLKEVRVLESEIWTPNLAKFDKFKKELARNEFMKFIELYQPLVGKKVNRVVVRDMQTRWGSCNSKKGYINLALKLIEKNPNLIEYVVLHELTHLLYPHHQKSFYKFIENLMPDYKQREKALKSS
ncbi:MAG: M48 family metallopeptidase [Campylobacteraceae bacterium]|nr:M48 family metallopeptidase [Campylobacteraceae bacterium]